MCWAPSAFELLLVKQSCESGNSALDFATLWIWSLVLADPGLGVSSSAQAGPGKEFRDSRACVFNELHNHNLLHLKVR